MCRRCWHGLLDSDKMTITPERFFAWRILPRFMMLVMTGVYIRCIEWALAQPDLTTQQASLISVVTGAMTGSLAVWLNSEKADTNA